MEIKKDPKVDLETRKSIYALTGLVSILAILFIAFEWTSITTRRTSVVQREAIEEEEEIVMTVQNNTPPPAAPAAYAGRY
jgi:protein TonB